MNWIEFRNKYANRDVCDIFRTFQNEVHMHQILHIFDKKQSSGLTDVEEMNSQKARLAQNDVFINDGKVFRLSAFTLTSYLLWSE